MPRIERGINFDSQDMCIPKSTPQTLREAERLIESCEHCNPDAAEIPFDNILDRVTGSDPSVTDYILESPPNAQTAAAGFSKRHLSSLHNR